jgi:hypothetical protein
MGLIIHGLPSTLWLSGGYPDDINRNLLSLDLKTKIL